MNYSKGTFTTSTAENLAITSDGVCAKLKEILDKVGPEPIGEYMRSCGKPKEGWILVLPASMRKEVRGPDLWPSYVKFSGLVSTPTFVARGSPTVPLSVNPYGTPDV